MIHVDRCPLCESDRQLHFATVQHDGGPVRYQICARCSLVFQSPRMTGEELERYYAAQYMLDHQRARTVTHKEVYVQRGRATSFLKMLDDRVGPGAMHLDIGCSTGMLIEVLQDQLGTSGFGVEPGETYRSYCQARGVTAYSSLEDVPTEKRHVHLITMAHVLEHLPDPVGYLRRLRENYMSPDGLLLLEVPNLYFHPSLELPHLFAFTPRTLNLTLEQSGFQVIDRRLHGDPRSVLFPFYITLLAKPTRVEGPERVPEANIQLVRLFRRLGNRARRMGERVFPKLAWLPIPKDGAA